MFRWLYILHIFYFLQADAISKRSLFEVDLSSVLSEEQLPREIIPTGYVLDLYPIPEDAYFKGRITINLEWQEESNKIVLHADPELVLYQTELVLVENESPSRSIKILRSERDPERSWYIIHLRKSLDAGTQAQLSMTFTGKLNTEEHQGLFLSTYQDSDSEETKYFVGSSFKPNFARKVFPCFDEPEFKVPFTLSLVRRNTMTGLSNMPVQRSEELSYDPTWTRDYFQESSPMSAHSLGILVSDFTSLSVEDAPDIEKNFDAPIQIWGPPNIVDAAQNFSETIFKTVNSVGEILGLPYPFPKLDYVFIPGLDLSNSGLIIQSEPAVPHLIYNVISQWIGNTVTPKVWSDEILTDALAVYLTMYQTTKENTDQDILQQFLRILYSQTDKYFNPRLASESSDAERALYTTKIVLILRMLEYTLGEKTLNLGLQKFVSETKFRTYVEADIWNAITDQAHSEGTLSEELNVNDIAGSWILASQFPIITVKRNYRDNSATFSQHDFVKMKEENDVSNKWITPIVVVKQSQLDFTNTVPLTWLQEDPIRLTKISNRDHFIIVNPEEIGPFIVNYDERNWKLLGEFLQNQDEMEKIPTLTRVKLLRDVFDLAFTGELSYKVAFDMLLFLFNENQESVWLRFFVVMEHIEGYVSDSSELSDKLSGFLRQLLLALYRRLDINEDEQYESLLLAITKNHLRRLGFIPFVDEAKHGFYKWMETDGPSCDAMVSICTMFHWGSEDEVELGFQYLIDSTDNETGKLTDSMILTGLSGCAANSFQVERILNATIFEHTESFTESDIEITLIKLAEYAVGHNALFAYLYGNWDALKERFEEKEELWKLLIESATSHFKSAEGLDLVQNFYNERKDEFGAAESTIETALETVKIAVEQSGVNYPVIEGWLDDYLKNHKSDGNDDFYLNER